MFSKIVYLLNIMVHCILIIHVAEKLCCEWTTLFILIVTDTQRRLIAALVIDERRKKSAKWISTVQCTQESRGMTLRNHTNSVPWMLAVTSTPYHEWPRSHQLRTMNDRGHTNSVPWMHAVCRLRKATFIQTNCVHSLYGVCVTAFSHGTELMRFGKVQKSVWSDFGQSKWL